MDKESVHLKPLKKSCHYYGLRCFRMTESARGVIAAFSIIDHAYRDILHLALLEGENVLYTSKLTTGRCFRCRWWTEIQGAFEACETRSYSPLVPWL